jgi:epoxyqueuosine reductase
MSANPDISPDLPLAQRAALVHRLAAAEAFTLLGIAPAQPSAYAAHLRQWLAAGKHGQMAYLADPARLAPMLDPAKLLPGARSIICVADRYALKEPAPSADDDPDLALGRIARYAWGNDYHEILTKRLHRLADGLHAAWPGHAFRSAVDTAPVLEREHAMRAGLGWVGKNTLLIHPRLGSYLALGEIITTLTLQTSAEAGSDAATDHCGTCTRCIDACPTAAIAPQGYSLDARRCLSYLTIEHRGPIDPALHPPLGSWLAGCDVCQEVCPFNHSREPWEQRADTSTPAAYQPRPPAPAIALLHVLTWSSADRQRVLQRSALKRIALDDWKRNALIAAGNYLARHDDPELRQRIAELSGSAAEGDAVRQTARQVLERLAGRPATSGPPLPILPT